MNLIDLAILILFVLFALSGYHKGFLKAILNVATFFISLLGAWILHPQLAESVNASGKIIPIIVSYSESSEMLSTVESFRAVATDLTADELTQILNESTIPEPLPELLTQNVQNASFASDSIVTLGDYLSMTIAHMAVNLVSFIIIFLAFYLVFNLIINLLDYVMKFPVLKLFDNASGALLGFIQGFLIMFLIFSVVPLILAFLPFPEISDFVEQSKLGNFFYQSNFIINMIKGIIN